MAHIIIGADLVPTKQNLKEFEKGKSIDIIKDEIKNYLSSSVDPSLWDKLVTFLINNMSYE